MPDRPYLRTLNPYSRVALVIRGWGFEVGVALGLVVLTKSAVALDGEGLGVQNAVGRRQRGGSPCVGGASRSTQREHEQGA